MGGAFSVTRRTMMGSGASALMLGGACAHVPAGALSKDIALLRRAYETLHPGLYRYNSPSEMAGHFDRLAAAWSAGQTRAEAYLSLSRFLARVRCGHTYANFFNQSKEISAELFSGRDKLPFHFRWIARRMIVTDAKGVEGLQPGDEISAINGRSGADILGTLLPFTRADGGNDAKRVAQLNVIGLERIETFDVFNALLHPARDAFVLTVRSPRDGATRTVKAPPITLEQRRAQMAQDIDDKTRPVFSLEFAPGNVAVLKMPNWGLYDSKWDWKGFIDDAFRQLADRRSPALIVDLRGNEGGLDCGDEVIARLIGADLQRAAYERRVRYVKTPADLDPFLDTWDDSFRDWGADAVRIDDRYYRLLEEDGESRAPIRAKGPRFTGKVVVLVDASNSSATFQFANLVQANRLGTLVGEPTGGNLRGINGGAFFFLRLPESGLEADLPLIGTFPQTPQPDAGVVPDVAASTSSIDIATGRDSVMETAMAIASRA
ncbi:MAG: S41 family peptidase [Hyphomonadaceae bacterium]|nr:S41 family peptidase [Hyphomonadaceae bacterium]